MALEVRGSQSSSPNREAAARNHALWWAVLAGVLVLGTLLGTLVARRGQVETHGSRSAEKPEASTVYRNDVQHRDAP